MSATAPVPLDIAPPTDLNKPVGTLTSQFIPSMITRSAKTREECVKKAQQLGACGVADDFCQYYAFEEGPPSSEPTFFGGPQAKTAGKCYIGPDSLQGLDLSQMPYNSTSPLALYITPAPAAPGDTPEQVQQKTAAKQISRAQQQTNLRIAQEEQANKGKQIALKIMKTAVEQGISYEQAQKDLMEKQVNEITQTMAQQKMAQLTESQTKKGILEAANNTLQALLNDKNYILNTKDKDVNELEGKKEEISSQIKKIGQQIIQQHDSYKTKDSLAQILLMVLFGMTIMVFLMFVYYGVKYSSG